MKKVLIRLFVVFCLTLSIVIAAPFHIVNADVDFTTSNILGISAELIDYEKVQTAEGSPVATVTIYSYIYEVTITLDNYYKGTIEMSFRFNYHSGSGSNITYSNVIYDGPVYGNKIVTSIRVRPNNDTYPNPFTSISDISITSSSLMTYNPNDWAYPMESLNFVTETAGKNFTVTDFYNLGNWIYPMFSVPRDSQLWNKLLTDENGNNPYFVTIFWSDLNLSSTTQFENNFTVTNGIVHSVDTIMNLRYNGSTTRIVKVTIKKGSGSGNTIITNDKDILFIPIYSRRSSEMGFETKDFCDVFKLPYNDMTSEQEQSAADLQDEQSEFSSSASDLYTYENTFNESLNDSLDDINVNFDIGNTFGSKFLASASWVRQQFDALTSTSPFGSVLSFSLVLGIALLVIGKAIK